MPATAVFLVAVAVAGVPACGEDTTVAASGGVDAQSAADGAVGNVGADNGTAGVDAAPAGNDAASAEDAATGADVAADVANGDGSGEGDGSADIANADGAGGGDGSSIDEDAVANNDGTAGSDGGSTGSDGGSVGDDAVANNDGGAGNDGGSTGSDGGSTGSDGGSVGDDAVANNDGSTGSDSGSTGNDSGSTGNDGGSTGSDGGSTGSDGSSTGSDGGSTGSDSGSTGSDSGSTGGDSGSDGGSTGNDGGSSVCKVDADCGKAAECATLACVGGACVPGVAADGAACSDGNACTILDACKAGKCEAGSLNTCDDKNPCTTDTCDPAKGNCSSAPAAGTCDDGNACTAGDTCKDGKCQPGAPNTCDDKNVCTADACDPAKGGCANTPQAGKCDDGSACTSDDACDGGKCAGKATVSCDDGNSCTTDSCNPADGSCNFKATIGAACDDGNACTDKDACNNSGKCLGATKSCDDSNACTDDSCDPKAGCANKPNTLGCDDGNICTDKDACKDGKCAAGAAKACDDGNACTDDKCDPAVAGGCVFNANTAPCNASDLCQAAQCKDAKCQPLGGPKDCNDKNDCTADSCDPKVGCVNKANPDGSQCAAGDACIKPSLCAAGKCNAGGAVSCDDGNACTNDTCDVKVGGCSFAPNSNPCDDGNACTVGDKCGLVPGQGAKCISGPAMDPKQCDDSNVCTTDSCDPKVGCAHANNTAACDDGNKCTSNDVCAAGKCAGAAGNTCDDGNPCTKDQCDPASGNCSWGAITGACDDGNACTAGETCSNGKCGGGTAKVCDDKNPCTIDACDAKTGTCSAPAGNDGAACDDGTLCTSNDACAAGKCAGTAVNCDDANACTTDTCDATTGKCSNANNTNACDDGDACTGGDICAAGVCKSGNPLVCDDKNACTTDTCDKVKGCVYTNVANGTACDDGIACTNASSCTNGACTPTVNCTFLNDPFECGAPTTWTITTPQSTVQGLTRAVVWKVDKLAAVGTPEQQANHQCSMNFNNDTNYCDGFKVGNESFCMVPAGTARTTNIDWTANKSGSGRLIFDTYYDVDTGNASATEDVPQVVARDSTTNAVLWSNQFPKGATDLKVWKNAVNLNVTALLGHKFYFEFSMLEPANLQFSTGDSGTGIYIDNVSVQLWFVNVPEVCNDGIDNNGDGKTDCQDTATCGNVFPCNATKLLDDPMPCTGDTNWVFVATDPNKKVSWAIDNTPAVAPPTGQCSMNYNDGTNYNVLVNNQPAGNMGTATLAAGLDATGFSTLGLTLKYYYDVENGNQSGGYDLMWLQVSTDDFAGCCNTNAVPNACVDQCNTANTATYAMPRTQWKTWLTLTQDIKAFAGKKNIKLRLRFNTLDGLYNDYPGVFIDDVLVLAAK